MSSFSDLHKKIVDENKFKIQILSFLNQIIRYELTPVDINQVLAKVKLSVLVIDNTSVFALQLEDNTNLVVS